MSDVAVSDLKGGHAPAQKVGGMRVVTKPRVSESEKPVEKPKEEGEEILPVENNWEKGVRKEFKPFSSEIIASQVSFVVATSFCLLLYPCVSLFV